MGFMERMHLANRMEIALVRFLNNKGFILEKTGYERVINKHLQKTLNRIHNNTTVRFCRYAPDFLAVYSNQYFYIEMKVMDTPIHLESRVLKLRNLSGLNDLNKTNIGVVETAAMDNYQSLSKIGVKIAILVFCTFNDKKLLMEWEEKIVKFHNDKVRIGEGNASFTSYTNVHLDKMRTFEEFLNQEFNILITKQEISSLINLILD